MIDRRLLGHNEHTGVTTYYNFDEETGDITLEEHAEVGTLLEVNKALANDRSGFKGEFHHVAHIPQIIVQQLMREGIWDDEERLKAWLNDRDNRAFRTLHGKL